MRLARIVALLLFFYSSCSHAAPMPVVSSIERPAKILFIGNSFTYYNDSLHKHIRALQRAANDGKRAKGRIRTMTISGARLAEHEPALRAMVASDNWDVVVLQGHSTVAEMKFASEQFKKTARRFDEVIRARGAQTAFFMTWAYTGRPEMTVPLSAHYTEIGNELGALVVPVGLAFERATDTHPDIALRHADRRHPTRAGSYLAACVFYAALFQRSPVGLAYDAGLSSDNAAALQAIAWSTTNGYFKK